MSFTGRLLGVRAAATSNNRPTRAGSASVMYAAPGIPQIPEWDGLTALRNGYLASLYVMRCARKTAEKLASFPFRAGADPDNPKDYNPVSPLSALLGPASKRSPGGPNPQWAARQFWIWSIIQRQICGKMAWETVTTGDRGAGQVVALWPLVAPFLMPVPSGAKTPHMAFASMSPYDLTGPGTPRYFDGYDYQLPTGHVPYLPDEVFYSWRPSQLDPRQPESVLQAASLPVSLQVGLERYLWALAKNGMVGKTLVVTPAFEEDSEEDAFRSQFLAEFTGYDNAGKTMFATIDDDADVNARVSGAGATQRQSVQALKLDNTPTDAQALELLQAMYEQIRVAFGTPKSKLVDATDSTYANAEQDDLNWIVDEIIPLGREIADDVNTRLAGRLGDDVGWFDFSEALKPRGVFAAIAPDNALKAGLIQRNDWRADVGLDALPDEQVDAPLEVTASPDGSVTAPDTGDGDSADGQRAAPPDKPIAAGLAVKALDTGRVLLLQRAMSDDDPASGTWEFPGGKLEPDEDPFAAAVREWQEEVGCSLPQGRVAGSWTSPNGVYRGFVYLISGEALVACNLDHEDRHVLNPDDPDGDQIEVVAWWNPAQLPAMTGLRPEARKGTDWHLIATAGAERMDGVLPCGHRAGVCAGDGPCDVSPTGHGGDNFVTRGGGFDSYLRAIINALKRSGHPESEAVALAIGTVKRWARGEGNVSAATRARAAKSLAHWEALKAKAHATPNTGGRGDRPGHPFHGNQWTRLLHGAVVGNDLSSVMRTVKADGHARMVGHGAVQKTVAETARARLAAEGITAAVHPVTVDGRTYTRVFDRARHASTNPPQTRDTLTEEGSSSALLPVTPMPTVALRQHMFVPSKTDRRKCGVAGCGQRVTAQIHGLSGRRHAGKTGHHRVPTGHLAQRRRQTLNQVHRQADSLEPSITRAMTGLFTQQKAAVLSRLNGRRGQQMIRAATPPDDQQPPDQPAPLVDAGQVFDLAYWAGKTRDVLDPVFAAVTSLTADRFAGQLGDHAADSSLGAVRQVLDARLARLAQYVSQTTFNDVANVLRQGVIGGQTVQQMTAALEHVFTDAESNRAATIARTESIGALNEAAATYADQLSPDVVAGREWLSAHDNRVRETHRVADGQIQPMGQPYLVGGVPMLFPHDPAAPPDETVNCRCTQAFLTPAEYAKRTSPASVAA